MKHDIVIKAANFKHFIVRWIERDKNTHFSIKPFPPFTTIVICSLICLSTLVAIWPKTVCLFDLILSHQQSFSYIGTSLLGLNQYLARINVLAQGHNLVMPVRLEPTTLRSQVKHSTTEPLRSAMGKLINRIPGSHLLISSLPGSSLPGSTLRAHDESLGKPRNVSKHSQSLAW